MKFKFILILSLLIIGMSQSVAMEKEPRNIVEAAKNGNVEAVKRFLDQGVSPDSATKCYEVPFSAHGEPVSSYQAGERTALGEAIENNQFEICKLLIDSGANMGKKSYWFERGNVSPLSLAIEKKHTDIVKLLIEKGAEVNSNDSRTPLAQALKTGQLAVVKLLIEKGADVNENSDERSFIPSS